MFMCIDVHAYVCAFTWRTKENQLITQCFGCMQGVLVRFNDILTLAPLAFILPPDIRVRFFILPHPTAGTAITFLWGNENKRRKGC